MAKGNKKQQTKSASVRTAAAAPEPDMSLARKIAWWSLLAMIFIVPIAMSNFTWLGGKMPLTYDQFDIFKVFFQRVLGLIALAAWGWDILMRGGKIRRNPVDWLILAFLAWVALTTILSISPATAIFGKYRRFEGLLSFINYAVIYFLVMQFADRPSRVRTLAKTLFWSGLIVTGYGVLQSVGVDPVKWGQLPFEARRAFATYGNPDLLGGFLMFSIADHARTRALRGQAIDADRLLARLRREHVVLDRGLHPWRVDRRARQHPARRLHRISPPRPVLQGRLDTGRRHRRAGGGHHRCEPEEPQRGHELRLALQVDRRLPGGQRQDPNSRYGRRPSPRFRIARSSVSGRIRSGSSSPSTSRSSTSRLRATARSPTTSTTIRSSSQRVSVSSAS